MSGTPENLNGSTGAMSPHERRIWAASHNLPEQYLLVTREEMLTIGNAMNQATAQNAALLDGCALIERTLGDYFANEPDLPNGVAAAVFDARRYKKAVDLTLPALRAIKKRLDSALLAAKNVNMAVSSDLLDVSKELRERADGLEKQIALRRERRVVS